VKSFSIMVLTHKTEGQNKYTRSIKKSQIVHATADKNFVSVILGTYIIMLIILPQMSYMSGEYAEIIAFCINRWDVFVVTAGCVLLHYLYSNNYKNTNNNPVHPQQQRRCVYSRLGVTRKLLIRGFMVGLEFVNYVKRSLTLISVKPKFHLARRVT